VVNVTTLLLWETHLSLLTSRLLFAMLFYTLGAKMLLYSTHLVHYYYAKKNIKYCMFKLSVQFTLLHTFTAPTFCIVF